MGSTGGHSSLLLLGMLRRMLSAMAVHGGVLFLAAWICSHLAHFGPGRSFLARLGSVQDAGRVGGMHYVLCWLCRHEKIDQNSKNLKYIYVFVFSS